jgi:hypothetical protein
MHGAHVASLVHDPESTERTLLRSCEIQKRQRQLVQEIADNRSPNIQIESQG